MSGAIKRTAMRASDFIPRNIMLLQRRLARLDACQANRYAWLWKSGPFQSRVRKSRSRPLGRVDALLGGSEAAKKLDPAMKRRTTGLKPAFIFRRCARPW